MIWSSWGAHGYSGSPAALRQDHQLYHVQFKAALIVQDIALSEIEPTAQKAAARKPVTESIVNRERKR
ncbi:MAG: hypothetical protein R2854_20595 [Caldilineaceae bacterium]